MRKVRVRLGLNSYDILIGPGLLAQTGQQLQRLGPSTKLVIITDPSVNKLYGTLLSQSLAASGYQVATLQVPEGEEQKSLENAGRLYSELSNFYAERTTPILALGGGVIGDLAGFVAATYLRGVPLIQLPTTLLAQVDSSIGGKVAVDHGGRKNKIGAFYQPKLVIADTTTLKTLPPQQISDGLAEVIKYAVIRDRGLFEYLEHNLDRIRRRDERALNTVVYRSARIKAEVVAKDERDWGLRQILNYGHTIGHAIESTAHFRVEHGQAVAIGMLTAARISNRLGLFDRNELTRLKEIIHRAGLATEMPGLDGEELIQFMKHDKKIHLGRIRFVLPKRIGEVFITDEVEPSLVKQVLAGVE